MKAVVTVIGKDMVGLMAKVSGVCAQHNANVTEVTQSVLSDLFAMIMLTDITDLKSDLGALSDDMEKLAQELGLQIHVMHEDIFNSMHRI